MAPDGGKAVSESMETSLILGATAPDGCPNTPVIPLVVLPANDPAAPEGWPKTLVVPPVPPATDPKPPLLANAEKPPDAAGVLLPNTLLVFAAPADPKLDWPNAGVAVAVDWAAQGDDLLPRAVDG